MTSTSAQMRQYQGPTIFSFGFRPFFLAGALFAAALPLTIVASMSSGAAVGEPYGAIAYHGHEMVFGFLAAIISGFLLTAVPNWTGRFPVVGSRLAAVFTLWAAGRVAMIAAGTIGMSAAAIIDVSYLIVFDFMIGREILKGRNWRNLPVAVAVGLLAIGNILWHAHALGGIAPQFGARWGLAVVAMLIALIGGRITPSFTRNWLMRSGRAAGSAAAGPLDSLSLAWTGGTLAYWLIDADGAAVSAALFVSAALHIARLARWRGWRAAAEPLVAILHIGYLWLPISLAMLGASAAFPSSLSLSTALHSLTAGAAGVMILAVTTRATLGHTGRPLTADAATIAIFALVNLGAILRVAAPFLSRDYAAAMAAAAFIWSGAFLLFAIVYGRYLLNPRCE